MLSVSILDETTTGGSRSAGAIEFESAAPTLREIIRLRVRQEVERFNRAESPVFRGLVQPEETERTLNGIRQRRAVDWERQYDKAIAAFRGNGLLVLVDDRQIADLEETVPLTDQTRITFFKLVPLAGG